VTPRLLTALQHIRQHIRHTNQVPFHPDFSSLRKNHRVQCGAVANATPAPSRFPSAHRRHKDRTKPAFLSRIRPNVIQDKEGRQQASQPVNPLKGRPKANNCATRRVQSDTPDQHDPGLNQSNLVMRHPSPGFFAKHDVGRGRGIASSFTAWM
jgi:hypothetical protein